MFDVDAPFLLFDYFGVPHQLCPEDPPARLPSPGCRWARWRPADGSAGPALMWPAAKSPPAGAAREAFTLSDIPLFGQLLDDEGARRLLSAYGGSWSQATPLLDARGGRAGSIWRDGEGNLFLPFDPAEVVETYWDESYAAVGHATGARWRRAMVELYYRIRPALPRVVQIAVRRSFSHIQSRSQFPRWPVEPALHDFYDWLLTSFADLAQEPVPWIAPWPDGHSWAFVLTHDVETQAGYENLPVVREVEVGLGYRSSWNFVPERYVVAESLVDDLLGSGFEVGIHGLRHDGRDLVASQLASRLPRMRSYADRWQAVGFRAPATRRDWAVMPTLGFDYDSSSPDTDPFEPQPGGCCSWLPFFNGNLVELPITLPQDHTLFVILRNTDGHLWTEKAEHLRGRGGLALLVTHPDYLHEQVRLDAYRALLEHVADDPGVWRALPREVASWWRRRAASELRLVDGRWCVVGPAAQEGRVCYAVPARSDAAVDLVR